MPNRLDAPVLTVDINIVHKVDTANPQNLHSMWSIFSRCAESVEHGRRLENLSWRMWQRAQFCCDSDPTVSTASQTSPRDIPCAPRLSSDPPQLSGSVESATDEEAVEFTSVSAPLDISRPRIRRQDSTTSSRSRGRERHITSDDFEKMIMSIIQTKGPPSALSAPPATPSLATDSDRISSDNLPSPSTPLKSDHSESPAPPSQVSSQGCMDSPQPLSPKPSPRATTVVKGFATPCVPTLRFSTPAPQKSLEAAAMPMTMVPKKQPARFALGGSCSSSEQDQSFDAMKAIPRPTSGKVYRSNTQATQDDSSLKSALHKSTLESPLSVQKKQTSFNDHVVTRTIEPVMTAPEDQSETDGDFVDESAIEDDEESSEWEDSLDDSGKSSVDDSMFQRVDSKPNLTSRRSLITLMLEHDDRVRALGNASSQSTSAISRSRGNLPAADPPTTASSPNDSDEAALMMRSSTRQSKLKTINETSSRTGPQPILVVPNQLPHPQAALSPRTTRKKMLSTELTDSLRRSLLWERQQKTSTANAVLKRRHTSHDVANLRQFPEKVHKRPEQDSEVNNWNLYFAKDAFSGYHSKGW